MHRWLIRGLLRWWLIVVPLQGNRMDVHIAFDMDELNAVEGHSVLEHAKVNIVDGDLEGSRLGQDQDVEQLACVQRHAAKALLGAPHLIHHVIAHNYTFVLADAQMERNVIPGLSNASSLEV